MSKIKLPADICHLRELIQFVSSFAKERGFTQKKIRELELIVEEVFVNISNYAYPDIDVGAVEIRCQIDNDAILVIDILDTGIPFDIRSLSEPDLDANISKRKVGGLGIFLIQKMVDELHYRREGESNILTLIIRKSD